MNNIQFKPVETVFVFIPNSLKSAGYGNLRGFSKRQVDTFSFYVTDDRLFDSTRNIVGYCSDAAPVQADANTQAKWIHLNPTTGRITLRGLECPNLNVIRYNYEAFVRSDLAMTHLHDNDHFQTLTSALQCSFDEHHQRRHSTIIRFVLLIFFSATSLLSGLIRRLDPLLKYSATAMHLKHTIDSVRWICLAQLDRLPSSNRRRTSLGVANVFAARALDLLCGVCVLYVVRRHEIELQELARQATESIVQGLEQLVTFLMGSPAGLKLNKAFNRTLGTFFLYNISLWRAFLAAAAPLLAFEMRLLAVLGLLGLSFQAAIMSDLIAFSTFHVYCIYVYAARLYAVQVRTLISLWRLFIGRKYNPLRKRVDSYEYDNHQLFVGTLGFTILLFLLPTTFLYYAVFTIFRIGMVFVSGVLVRLRCTLQSLPLYVFVLWFINSLRVRGVVQLSINNNIKEDKNEQSIIEATLQTLPLNQCVTSTTVCDIVEEIPAVSYGLVVQSVIKGTLL